MAAKAITAIVSFRSINMIWAPNFRDNLSKFIKPRLDGRVKQILPSMTHLVDLSGCMGFVV
jgi:hypothetical protein